MGIYLAESILGKAVASKEDVQELQKKIAEKGVELIETHVSEDLTRAFFVAESDDRDSVTAALRDLGISVSLIKPVRLVGKDLDEVKKHSDKVNYVVEWNLPENLTMDQYIERKTKGAAHYAEVPEVAFSRTYVCEDLTKCLCFYDSPDEEAVKRARKAVGAPVDTVTEIWQGLI